MSVLLALSVLAPPPEPTVPLVVAGQALPAGHVLSETDLASLQVPPAVVPQGAMGRQDALGQVLAAPVAAGEPITQTRVRFSSLLRGAPATTVALPVRVADPGAAALVAPGDRIDLLAAVLGPDGVAVRTVGRDLAVLLAPQSPSDTDAGEAALGVIGGTSPPDLIGGIVVVAATQDQAAAIVGAAADGTLWVALRGPPSSERS